MLTRLLSGPVRTCIFKPHNPSKPLIQSFNSNTFKYNSHALLVYQRQSIDAHPSLVVQD
jgi:hypothetical protein